MRCRKKYSMKTTATGCIMMLTDVTFVFIGALFMSTCCISQEESVTIAQQEHNFDAPAAQHYTAHISDPIIRRGSMLKDFCNKSVDIYEDIASPRLTTLTYGKSLTCWYKFRSFGADSSTTTGIHRRQWILRIRFKKFKFGHLINANECVGGHMQIVDGNLMKTATTMNSSSIRKNGGQNDQGMFCGEIEQQQTFLSESSSVKLIFQTDNYTDQTYYSFDTRAEHEYDLYLRFGRHPELYPNRRGILIPGSYCDRIFKDCRLQTCYVQSPAYPGFYPRALRCTYRISTKLPFIKLYMQNEHFNVDGQPCENIISCPIRQIQTGRDVCQHDYLTVYDGVDSESGQEIGTFCGMGEFPFSIVGSGRHLFLEFVSSQAGPLLNTGFNFNVGNWPGHMESTVVGNNGNGPIQTMNGSCSWIVQNQPGDLSSNEGIFLSVLHWYKPNTYCTYLLQGTKHQIIRVYFPSFRINKMQSPIVPHDGDCAESLTLYDASWPDDSKIIKTFCDTFSRAAEKREFISSGPSVFIRFHSKTGSYSGSSLYYWAHYDFFNNEKFGNPISGTLCDEEFLSWNQKKGVFGSPFNTLVYKSPIIQHSKNSQLYIRCRYKFRTDQQLYGRVIISIKKLSFLVPSNRAMCANCWIDKTDKLLLWEEDGLLREEENGENITSTYYYDVNNGQSFVNENIFSINLTATAGIVKKTELQSAFNKEFSSKWICLCNINNSNPDGVNSDHFDRNKEQLLVNVISINEVTNVDLLIDSTHAASSYFKRNTPLFEGAYEFIHPPICGPIMFKASHEGGQLHFPNEHDHDYMNHHSYKSSPEQQQRIFAHTDTASSPPLIHCIWDIGVNKGRDISVHFEFIRFMSTDCQHSRLSLYLPSLPAHTPYMIICPHNVTSLYNRNNQPHIIIPSNDLIPSSKFTYPKQHHPNANNFLRISFNGLATSTKLALKIIWTELYHLPRMT